MSKSVSSGSVSVAKESSSDAVACGNFSKGGAFKRLHCVATLFCWGMADTSVCVSIDIAHCVVYVCN